MHDSAFGRLVSVLIAPGKTFRSIAERPTWGVVFVVLAVLTIATTLLLFQKVDFVEGIQQQAVAQGQEPPPEEAAGMIRGCSLAVFIIIPFVFYFGIPLLLWGAFTLLGGTINYKISLAVTLHAMMPLAVAALLAVPVILGREEFTLEQVQSGSVLASNLAQFAPEDASPVLVALLASVDVFTIWTLLLLILGYHIAARVSKVKAAATVLALWVVGVLLKVGGAALGTMRGGGA